MVAIFSLPLFCQAQNDTSFINKIDRTVARVDKDTALDCFYTGFLGPKGSHGFLSYYVKGDSIYKVVMLNADSSGTQMKTYYYINSAPILAIVKHNNFQLSHDIKQYTDAVLSFNSGTDINGILNKPLYLTDHQTLYYIYQGKGLYSKTINGDLRRMKQDSRNDDALRLVFEAQYLFSGFNRGSKDFIKTSGG